MIRKWLAVGIILLFLGVTIAPTINAQDTKKSKSTSRGNWLYVGGSGPGNYTTIQDGIDDATEGDTVYVYSGKYTSVLINKYITLLGENKSTTIIDATRADIGITIVGAEYSSVAWINISGFTIRNATAGEYGAGIFIANYENPIRNINIYDNIIKQNIIGFINFDGVDCQVYKNIIKDNKRIGLDFLGSRGRTYVTNNIITNNPIGINAAGYEPLIIEMNQIESNEVGIALWLESEDIIKHNNFINNEIDSNITGFFTPAGYIFWKLFYKNIKWVSNYWDEWKKIVPKPITGSFELEIMIPWGLENNLAIPLGTYPYIRFDWHPALEPYDIPGIVEKTPPKIV